MDYCRLEDKVHYKISNRVSHLSPVHTASNFFPLYVARRCTVKTHVGIPTAVALMLLVDRTSGHIFTKCNHKLYIYITGKIKISF